MEVNVLLKEYNNKPIVLFFQYFFASLAMEIKEYLLSAKDIKLSDLAKRMYPRNSDAADALYKKLHGNRRFSKKDAELAIKALKELGLFFDTLTVADSYE